MNRSILCSSVCVRSFVLSAGPGPGLFPFRRLTCVQPYVNSPKRKPTATATRPVATVHRPLPTTALATQVSNQKTNSEILFPAKALAYSLGNSYAEDLA